MNNQGKIIGGFGVGLEEGAPLGDPKTIEVTDIAEGRDSPTEPATQTDTSSDQSYPAPTIPPIEHMSAMEQQNRQQTGTLHGADCTL